MERADLVGHSDGATIALLCAAAMPKRVGRVVAIAPHIFAEQVTIQGVRDFDSRNGGAVWRQNLARRHRDPSAAYDAWRDFWLSENGAEWSVINELSTCHAPLLLVQGGQDAFGSYAQLDATTRTVAGRSREMRLAGLGHEPHREEADTVARAVAEFLNESMSPGEPGDSSGEEKGR
nr:alpha/beta hydrolase [Limimaricola cinnabarinus]